MIPATVAKIPPAPHAVPSVAGNPRLEAVLFDAGLTLIHAASPASLVAGEAIAAHGVAASPEEIERAMSEAEMHIQARWLAREWWASAQLVRELFVEAYRIGLRVLRAVGNDDRLAARLADAVYDNYQHARHWDLYADVRPTLEALHAASVRMGVVSDWGPGLEALVLELDLGNYVTAIVVSSRLGIAKPDPRVFQMALARIRADPSASIYVGDTYVKDVLGARAAGLTPVLLDRAGVAPTLDCLTVRDLTGLLPLVGLPPVKTTDGPCADQGLPEHD